VRVALLDAGGASGAHALEAAGLGRRVTVTAPRGLDVALRARKLGDRLATVPPAWAALRRGGFELAHAFSAEDALAAAGWRGPLVLTITAAPERAEIARRRVRLRSTLWALGTADVVLAADDAVADGLRRWYGVDARVLATPQDHAAVYAGALRATSSRMSAQRSR